MRGTHRLKRIAWRTQAHLWSVLRMDDFLERREREKLSWAMGFPGQWDEHRRFQLDFLKSKGVLPRHRFLEIGSGPLTLGLPMIAYLDPNRYTGIDVRGLVNNIAHAQIAKAELADRNPRILTSSSFGADEIPGETFDFAMAFSVLFHLEDDLVERLLHRVGEVLEPQGAFWANINVATDESRWLEFPFRKRAPEFYREIAAKAGLKTEVLGALSDLGFRLDTEENQNVLLEFRHDGGQRTSAGA